MAEMMKEDNQRVNYTKSSISHYLGLKQLGFWFSFHETSTVMVFAQYILDNQMTALYILNIR